MGRIESVVAFGDELGLPRLLQILPGEILKAAVRAQNRLESTACLPALTAEHEVPLLTHPLPADPRAGSFVDAIREISPDLILVDSYSQRLSPGVLGAAGFGGINVHGSLLPRHRGANPTQWAIIDGDGETGVSIHRMSDAFDEGDVLAQERVPIGFLDTWKDVHRRLGHTTEQLLARELPRILEGDLRGAPQDERLATYRPRRTADDGRIDWSAPTVATYNLIRALVAPHPGAFYERDGTRVVLDRFVPIGEVAAMKFGSVGGQRSAVGFPAPDGDDIVVGSARISDIDWDARTARIDASERALLEFALEEFGLRLTTV